MEIAGSVAVVTGGASGIGRSAALEFARRGADVVVADLHVERMEEVAHEVEKLGCRAMALRCDVAVDADVETLGRKSLEAMGRVDLLMNNAGVALMGPPHRIPMEDWMWILQINLMGIVRGVRALVPHMLERGSGHVVNTASVAGLYAYSYDCLPYVTSKFAAYGYTEGLAAYLRPHGIGVTVLCPGLVNTNMGETARFAGVDDPGSWIHFPERMAAEGVEAESIGPMVADAVQEGRFLLHTHPSEALHVAQRRQDIETALAEQIEAAPLPPKIL